MSQLPHLNQQFQHHMLSYPLYIQIYTGHLFSMDTEKVYENIINNPNIKNLIKFMY